MGLNLVPQPVTPQVLAGAVAGQITSSRLYTQMAPLAGDTLNPSS